MLIILSFVFFMLLYFFLYSVYDSYNNGTPISQLWDVTCHTGSHSVTCHPTQVNAPHLNPSQ